MSDQKLTDLRKDAILATAGFSVWALFSLLPLLRGGALREAWDTAGYWAAGLPALGLMQAVVAATRTRPVIQEPLWTVAGHAVAVMLIRPPGSDLGLAPMAAVGVGLPLYVGLCLASLAGRFIASLR